MSAAARPYASALCKSFLAREIPAPAYPREPAISNEYTTQGLNTWHSFQYLAVVIFLNRYRQAHGMIGSATVARFAARGWGLYAVGTGLTG